MHLATLASAHCARPATGVAGARSLPEIPTDQSLPNPDDARPIVRRLGANPGTLLAQLALQYSALNHCATREAPKIILFNAHHKFTANVIFANELSDHCPVACIRDAKLPKSRRCIITKRNNKNLNEQQCLSDLGLCEWEIVRYLTRMRP